MTRTTSPSARLVQRLKAAFSNPPVKAGMRLNPERELARTLDVSPKCINRTLRLLTVLLTSQRSPMMMVAVGSCTREKATVPAVPAVSPSCTSKLSP